MTDSLQPGAYDQLVTSELARKIVGLPAERVLREALEIDEAPEILARHLKFLFRRVISAIGSSDDPVERLRISNQVVRALSEITDGVVTADDLVDETSFPILWGIKPEQSRETNDMVSPSIRLSESALLVNGRNQPSIGHELNKELTSADNVDLLCSFVMNTGLNIVEKRLEEVVRRGGHVRILTTTYMGATQRTAVDRLSRIGADVRISYDGTTTRLHAKSWLLERRSGATTAYVGSSNLSKAALTDGIEWNLKVSAREQSHIIDTIKATFEDYWNDPEFEPYEPDRDSSRLDSALSRSGSGPTNQISIALADIEVTPRPFQQEVLDQLKFQRDMWGRTRNLVAMATGTGKTVVAGLDFRRLNLAGSAKSVLFVAHRKEILAQSLATFRTIMRDGSFGELLVDGIKPTQWDAVFASIQSLNNLDLSTMPVDKFDMVIVDEFHHAAAATYERVLTHFEPRFLLGLTATPERSDGRPILQWFDNTISAELRLWEAIDRQILSPFQYFGIHDNTDLSAAVKWSRSTGYDVDDLTNLYTANDHRLVIVLEHLNRLVGDLAGMKGIGFCVSIRHADYMAEKFSRAGIPSVSVTSKDSSDDRAHALQRLKSGEIKMIFAVDIFNEGVDIPDVNTILMLRPTDSPVVFLQQLGRGLRKSETKSCLTVLDFVGNQNKEFRFDRKYGNLLGLGRNRLQEAIKNDFPYLPSGCHVELDKVSKEIVLNNLKSALTLNKSYFLGELRNIGTADVATFFKSTGISVRDFYRQGRSLVELGYQIFGGPEPSELDKEGAKALGRMLHLDDLSRIRAYQSILGSAAIDPDDPYTMMFAHSLFGVSVDKSSAANRIDQLRRTLIAREIVDVLEILNTERSRAVLPSDDPSTPLAVHGTYSRAEIVAAFGLAFTGADVAGVRFAKEMKADLAFVTLNKTELHFSPSTMYADTALSSRIFQWESQATTSETSETGRRYVNHREMGTSFHLFVRDWKTDPETRVTMPFVYFGPADYLSHVGSKPMRIQWRLQHEIPAEILVKSKVIAS